MSNRHMDFGFLCFREVDIPPSLQNIYKELHDDLGCNIPNNGYLTKWAEQGVLLLNTVLTVRAHQANSHQGYWMGRIYGCSYHRGCK